MEGTPRSVGNGRMRLVIFTHMIQSDPGHGATFRRGHGHFLIFQCSHRQKKSNTLKQVPLNKTFLNISKRFKKLEVVISNYSPPQHLFHQLLIISLGQADRSIAFDTERLLLGEVPRVVHVEALKGAPQQVVVERDAGGHHGSQEVLRSSGNW